MYQTKKLIDTVFFLALLGLLTMCGGGESSSEDSESVVEEKDTSNIEATEEEESKIELPTDRKFNDLARFIGGLSPEEGSAYATLSETAGWKQYAQGADATWKNITTQKIPTMRAWRDQELAELNKAGGTIFYPFSGADFLHAGIFFPNAEKIVMIGLEKPGTVPDFEKIGENGITRYFNGIRHTLTTIMEYSFFRTIAMAQDFTGRTVAEIDGTLPVILLFMARTEHKVLYIDPVAINEKGELVEREKATNKEAILGMRVAYQRKDHPEERKTLYYFQANIGDEAYSARSGFQSEGLKKREDLKTFLKNLDITATYIKSASYLMHRESFSTIRDLILKESKYYLQDDSGMPIKYIDKDKWGLTFYGSYYSPISLFSARAQADLRAVYAKGGDGVKPLPFGIGYQFRKGTSNLMLGVKK